MVPKIYRIDWTDSNGPLPCHLVMADSARKAIEAFVVGHNYNVEDRITSVTSYGDISYMAPGMLEALREQFR